MEKPDKICPKCGSEFQNRIGRCADCGSILVDKSINPGNLVESIYYQGLRNKGVRYKPAPQSNKVIKNTFPGVLWLFPIFFGPFGGIVAALIASLKYQASWWELFTVGLALPIAIFTIFVAVGVLFS